MKRNLLIAVALLATLTVGAQNIAVVSPSNATTIYQTLDEAIINAESGSIIYLPGGGFPVSNNAVIDKQLTIMGVSHRGDTDNVDGATIISGNLNFKEGASHSSIVGLYVSGYINVKDSVAGFTARYCNVKSFQVSSSKSSGMVINQCFIRALSDFNSCNVTLENNIMHSIREINGGIINHNIITSNSVWESGYSGTYAMYSVQSSTITNNFILSGGSSFHSGDNCFASNNCRGTASWGENPIVLAEGAKWEDIFVSNKGVNIYSDYHLKTGVKLDKGLDGTDIGIYGGSGFSDQALAPIPRIVSKKVDEMTDGTGRLRIEVTVKAN